MDVVCAHLTDDLVRYVRAGVSVNWVGMVGSGRTSALDEAAKRLTQLGCNVQRVAGISMLRERPLVALSVSGLEAGSNSVVGAVAALAKALAGPRSVLVVDDADELDEVSMGVIAAARCRTAFPVLAATRTPKPGRAGPNLVAELQPNVRLQMRPLRFDELHRMVHGLLPGPVASPAVAHIATLSGGLPGLVLAVVDAGVRTGRLVQAGGCWQAGPGLYSERLTEVVELLLRDVGQAERAALTRLAIVGGVEMDDAQRLMGPERLGALEESGFVHICGPAQVAAVFPPLVAEHLRAVSNTADRQAALAELNSAGLGSPGSDALPRRKCAGDAILLSSRIQQHWQAQTAARRARWRADPVPHTAVPLLVALHAASADAADFREVFEATESGASDPGWRLRLALWRAIHLSLTAGDAQAAFDLLDGQRGQLPEFDALLEAARAHLELVELRVPDVPEPANCRSALLREALEGLGAEVLIVGGEPAAALQILQSREPELSLLQDHWDIFTGLAQLFSGQIEAALQWSGAKLREAKDDLDPGLIMAHGYVQVLGLALSGQFQELDATAASILTLTGESTLFGHFQLGLLTLTALAAAWEGRKDYARDLAAQAAKSGKLGPLPGMLAAVAAELVDGDGGQLWQVAADRIERGYLLAGIFAAAEAVEAGPHPLAKRVGALAGRLEPGLGRALAGYVGAAAAGDIPGLR
ncbi:MAG: hypothetical protein LBQ92_02200, partial [Propionibacteriaceae bacterium]|nr:hypothetical protein [Propionibacteriaceae bacterium]